MGFEYAPEARQALAGHGLVPAADTPPPMVREALSDLYRYEIRRLRSRLLAGGIARTDYVPAVIALRQRYWLLSVPVDLWAVRR